MHLLEYLVSLFKKRAPRRQHRINSLESSLLGQLPIELISYITEFMDPVSAASFSFCSQQIYSIIGPRYLKALQQEDHRLELYEFLTPLEPLFPDHVLCYYCKKLHSMTHVRRYIFPSDSRRVSYPKCKDALGRSLTSAYISPSFSWMIFQSTMKRYRQGLDYSKLLRLLSYHYTRTRPPWHVQDFAVLPRIANGCLLLRTQVVFLPFRWADSISICPHAQRVGRINAKSRNRFGEYIQYRMTHWQDEPESREAGMMQCEYCRTEFRLDFKEFEGHVVMVFTKWQDFGRGVSPLDHDWRSHVIDPDNKYSALWERVDFKKGSISNAFERGKEFNLPSLTDSWRKEWLEKSRLGSLAIYEYLSENEGSNPGNTAL